MKINIEDIFNVLKDDMSGSQKKLDVQTSLGVYYGITKDGYLRISFLSSTPAPKLESTKLILVTQGKESSTVYWTCFDLIEPDIKQIFFLFCSDLIESILDIDNEKQALQKLRKRYIVWKTMFKNEVNTKIPREVLQGLYGELYFLKNYIIKKYSLNIAVNAWAGPDRKNKDFSMNEEWYEVKTIGANVDKVKISSLAQLDSTYDGRLIVIRVESMSNQFDNGESSIADLLKQILSIIDDETIESIFLSKVQAIGAVTSDEFITEKFDVKSVSAFLVKDDFPRLLPEDVNKTGVCDVVYSLFVEALKPYEEEIRWN